MASKLKKIACDVSIDDPVSSTDDSELGSEDIDLQFTGRLSFRKSALGGDDSGDLSADDEDSDRESQRGATGDVSRRKASNADSVGSVHSLQLGSKANKFHPGRTIFEVVSAKTMKDGNSRFVLYTVAVLRTIKNDTSQATVERRYSDFHQLNTSLRKRFPRIMENIEFPRKTLTRSFKHDFIAERSRAFEAFLTCIYKYECIRLSAEFQDFFYNHDLRIAYRYMTQGNFQEAVPFLQNTLHLQEKMLGPEHPDTARTQCALIVAYMSLEEGEAHVHGYAESAWETIGKDETNPFLIPLLQILIGIRWRLQLDKRDLESRLTRYVKQDMAGPIKMPTLEDLIMQCLSHM
ncbi:sorting nexin-21-like [Acanthaster planci]|uniref:Sorting nexin-21-like n=1 Tax=Acanthaster planci TaxID=133434 RepID=A0A8B7ZYB5_ACAPL|nr:sorting nexin-21-like [Acanthaster planci]